MSTAWVDSHPRLHLCLHKWRIRDNQLIDWPQSPRRDGHVAPLRVERNLLVHVQDKGSVKAWAVARRPADGQHSIEAAYRNRGDVEHDRGISPVSATTRDGPTRTIVEDYGYCVPLAARGGRLWRQRMLRCRR